MKPLRRFQEGITLGGLIIVLAVLGVLVTFVLRAFPLYNEKFQIISSMQAVANNAKAASEPEHEVQKLFLRNIEATTNINRFTDNNLNDYIHVEKPVKKGEPKMLHVTYQSSNVLFKDLRLLLVFDEKMPMQGSGGGE